MMQTTLTFLRNMNIVDLIYDSMTPCTANYNIGSFFCFVFSLNLRTPEVDARSTNRHDQYSIATMFLTQIAAVQPVATLMRYKVWLVFGSSRERRQWRRRASLPGMIDGVSIVVAPGRSQMRLIKFRQLSGNLWIFHYIRWFSYKMYFYFPGDITYYFSATIIHVHWVLDHAYV